MKKQSVSTLGLNRKGLALASEPPVSGHLEEFKVERLSFGDFVSGGGWLTVPGESIKEFSWSLGNQEFRPAKRRLRPDVAARFGGDRATLLCGFYFEQLLLGSTALSSSSLRLKISTHKGRTYEHVFRVEPRVVGPHVGGDPLLSVKTALARLARAEMSQYLSVHGGLSFQEPGKEQPQVSVVIVSYGREEFLFKSLLSLQNQSGVTFEVIVVDNASPDACREFLRKVTGAQIHWNATNEHFLRGANQGAKKARGRHILFLNSDCWLTEGALKEMVHQLEALPKAGAVGPMVLRSDGLTYSMGEHLFIDGRVMPSRFGKDPLKFQGWSPHSVDFVSGACLLVRRADFDRLKGFDRRFEPAYYEDVDLALRLRQEGRGIYVVPTAKVIHVGNASSKDVGSGVHLLLLRHRQTLLQAHPKVFATTQRCPQFGINFVGHLCSEKGVGRSARSIIENIRDGKWNLTLNNLEDPGSENVIDFDLSERSLKNPNPVNIVSVHPDALSRLLEEFGDGYFDDKYNIANWVWETEELPASWIPSFSLFQEVWTISDYSASIFRRYTDRPVHTIPISVEPEPLTEVSWVRARFKELNLNNKFVFYFAFDFASSLRRKNVLGLISAFESAFGSNRRVALLIKSSRGVDYPGPYAELKAAVGNKTNIVLWDEVLNGARKNSIYGCVDAYVSLHSSEGLGLTMAEAMSHGLPVIASDYGGNKDFMDSKSGLLVPGQSVRFASGVDASYPNGGIWFQADLDAAAKMMKRLYEEPRLRTRLARRGREMVGERLSRRRIRALIQRRLLSIRAQLAKSSSGRSLRRK